MKIDYNRLKELIQRIKTNSLTEDDHLLLEQISIILDKININ